METTKPWYTSKTILISLVGAIFALSAVFNFLPASLDQQQVVAGVLAVTSILAAFFRKGATAEITA